MLCDLRAFCQRRSSETQLRDTLQHFPRQEECIEADLSRNYVRLFDALWLLGFLSLKSCILSSNPQLSLLEPLAFVNLSNLELSGCGLKSIVLQCPNLKSLDLSKNMLNTIDPSIRQCRLLQRLFLHENEFRGIFGLESSFPDLNQITLAKNPRLSILQVEDPKYFNRLQLFTVSGTMLWRAFGRDVRPRPVSYSGQGSINQLQKRYQSQAICLELYATFRYHLYLPRDMCQLLTRYCWRRIYADPPSPPPKYAQNLEAFNSMSRVGHWSG